MYLRTKPATSGALASASLTNTIAMGADALTGPVARGDEDVIANHQRALDELDPAIAGYRA